MQNSDVLHCSALFYGARHSRGFASGSTKLDCVKSFYVNRRSGPLLLAVLLSLPFVTVIGIWLSKGFSVVSNLMVFFYFGRLCCAHPVNRKGYALEKMPRNLAAVELSDGKGSGKISKANKVLTRSIIAEKNDVSDMSQGPLCRYLMRLQA